MKFSEQWLREWVSPQLATQALADQITMAGLEVDAVEPVAAVFEGVVVAEVLEKVHAHYGEAEIRRLRLDVFSGDYNPRRKRGGSSWSMHAYGIAYDFDDINNQLSWRADRASFARPEYEDWWRIWEEEGWVSLGRSRDFDWMHIQAARV